MNINLFQIGNISDNYNYVYYILYRIFRSKLSGINWTLISEKKKYIF